MNKVIDKGFRNCRFVSTIVKHPVFRKSYTNIKRKCCSVQLYSFSVLLLDCHDWSKASSPLACTVRN